jgi:hypothetical protein
MEVDQAIQGTVVDSAVRLHRRDERHDAAAEHGNPSQETAAILLAASGAAQAAVA